MKKLIWILTVGLMLDTNAATIPMTSHRTPYFAYIDLLRWQMREGGSDNWAQIIPPAGTQVNIHPVDAPFEWKTGVRVGLGRTVGENNDFTIALTHYQSTASNQASGIVYSAFDANYFADNTNGVSLDRPFHSASIRWQFFFNTADFDLGHNVNLNQILLLHPHIGLKAASINQKIYTNWMNPVTPTTFNFATENLKNNFWGFGPTAGVDSLWPVYTDSRQSVDIAGNIGGGLICGHWNFSDFYSNNTPTTIRVNVSSVNGVSPMIGGMLGLQWARQFANADISLRLGYEEQVWFNQVQIYTLDMGRANRPTSLQGYDLEFRYTS